MAPAASKANYKSYEAQARMVRAIVAAHPEVKWNYKEIAQCYGSDMTEHALNHRFRRLRAQVVIVREARKMGLDMKHMNEEGQLPAKQESVQKNNIAKYFGQSTPDGIQFQFRAVKKDADTLRKVEAAGGDVASCLNLSVGTGPSLATTPSRGQAAQTPTSRGSQGRKRPSAAPVKITSSDDDEDEHNSAVDDEDDWSDKDVQQETPSKRAKTAATPRRAAASRANATIASASAQLQRSESPLTQSATDVDTPRPYTSIFGNVESKNSAAAAQDLPSSVFTTLGTDPYMSSTMNRSMYSNDSFFNSTISLHDEFGDGEF